MDLFNKLNGQTLITPTKIYVFLNKKYKLKVGLIACLKSIGEIHLLQIQNYDTLK
jgi:hypothetical protein